MTMLVDKDAVMALLEGLPSRWSTAVAIAAIRALPDAWRPISEAPKDGTPVIVRQPTGAGWPHEMLPITARHQGKIYSEWEYLVDPNWKPISLDPTALFLIPSPPEGE